MALTKARKIARAAIGPRNAGVAAAATCIQGGLAILAAGYARPAREGQGADNATKAADAATYRAVGVFAEGVEGGAANGDVTVDIDEGEFPFKNSAAADAITAADIGKPCFIVDDETVARTNPNNTRAVAGVVTMIDGDGVWVAVSLNNSAALTAALGL